MARPDLPLNIDRRRLLATGAAVATAAIALRAYRVDAALADTVQLPALTPEVPPLNVCAATARRVLEIARRNEIRREAKLPLLPIAKELRRMKRQEELEEFERFEAAYGEAVWHEVLKPRKRRATRTGFQGIGPRVWGIRRWFTRFSGNDFMRHAEWRA